MKCLSIHQPWAYLIANGRRTIDVRSWDTGHRGKFLIHSGMKIEWEEYKRLGLPDRSKHKWDISQLIVGAIIGSVNLAKTEYVTERQWDELRRLHMEQGERCYDEDTCCWFLESARLFRKPIPWIGRLGLFDVPDSLLREKRLPTTYEPVLIKGQHFYKPNYVIPD